MRAPIGGAAILIAAKNAEATIAAAVSSALRQDHCSEVVVVDDASTDRTAEAAKACEDCTGRLKILRLGVNIGPGGARNVAFAASRAPWVAVLDADDTMDPGRLGRLIHCAGADWDFVADDSWTIATDDPLRRQLWADGPFRAFRLDLARLALENLPDPARPRRELGFVKPLMRRAFLLENAVLYDPRLRLGEDFDLYARALLAGARFLVTPPMGYVALRRPDSLSASHAAADLARLRDALDRLRADPRATPRAAAALARKREAVSRELAWRRMIDAVRARDAVRALRALIDGPREAAFVSAQLLSEARRRVIRRAGLEDARGAQA